MNDVRLAKHQFSDRIGAVLLENLRKQTGTKLSHHHYVTIGKKLKISQFISFRTGDIRIPSVWATNDFFATAEEQKEGVKPTA